MQPSLTAGRFFLIFTALYAGVTSHALSAPTPTENSEAVTIHVGHGANVSYLAFAEPSLNPKPVIYAWHYDGLTNPDGTLRTGYDLFNAVAAETTGTPWALAYTTGASGLTTSFTIGSTTSRTVNPLTSPVWTYWIRGGSEYVEWGDVESFTFPVGDSLIVSPDYWYTRYISNGSYDVWTIAPFSYSGAASDTHFYNDSSGKIQPVTFGTYEGSPPILRKPPTPISCTTLPEGRLEMVFSVVEGGTYQLQTQEGLTPNDWQNLEPAFTATTTEKTYTFPMNNPAQRGFFRLVRKE
jgi:hypothetical protein